MINFDVHIFFYKKLVDKFFFIKYTLNIKIFINQNFDTSNYYFFKENKNMLEKIQSIVADQLSCDAAEVTLTASFKEDLNADSLDLFELVMALEEEYNVEIPSEDLAQLNTVEDVIKYLNAKGVE